MIFERPLVFFDTETTGVDTENDRIIEITLIKTEQGKEDNYLTIRVNPGVLIPAKASAVHGIFDEDVKDLSSFCQNAELIYKFVQNCDLVGFNSNKFDVPMLFNELSRCGLYLDYRSVNLLDVGNLFKIQEPRTLTAAVKFYTGDTHEDAHGALADTEATRRVFYEMLNKYTELPESVSELAKMANYDKPILDIAGKFSTDEDGDYVFNFGKERGKKVKDNISYLDWMQFKANFSNDTVDWINIIRDSFSKQGGFLF